MSCLHELCHVLFNHLCSNIFSDYLYHFCTRDIRPLAHFLWAGSIHLFFTCPNHLSIASFIISTTKVTLITSRISSFLVISISVCPHIHLNILIFTTYIFCTCKFLTDQHSAPYNNNDITTTL